MNKFWRRVIIAGVVYSVGFFFSKEKDWFTSFLAGWSCGLVYGAATEFVELVFAHEQGKGQ